MADEVEDLGPDELPIPFGIEAETGEHLAGISEADLDRIDPERQEVRERGRFGGEPLAAIADVDPNKLEEAGWCVVFAKDADPKVKEALGPLLQHREKQAKALFRVFEGADAVQPGESVRTWVERHGAGLFVVDPSQGVPLYMLLVGSPAEIPFEFQYTLDLYWSVGRLHFENVNDYRVYAENVVAYETAETLAQKRHTAIFVVKNDGDRATGLLHKQVALPLVKAGFKDFAVTPLLAADATKANLIELLRNNAPALLFTGSHGVKFKMDDPQQREKQGAILCQNWPGFGAVGADQMFTAADVPEDARVHGMIHYFFACYGGGCPKEDNFGFERLPLVPEAMVARLPQKLLTKGALGCLAHIDRAWAYGFQTSRSRPQVQEMRDVMVRILKGDRLGQAVDAFNMRWAVLSAELQESQDLRAAFADQAVSDALLANRYVARNDARNYIVIGDPAVRLRIELIEQLA